MGRQVSVRMTITMGRIIIFCATPVMYRDKTQKYPKVESSSKYNSARHNSNTIIFITTR